MRNTLTRTALAIVAIVVLFWLLRIALKLAIFAVIAAGAVALFYAARNRIGGPRA